MIFEPVNYSFLLQDFLYAIAVGFAVGGINQIMLIFLPKGKKRLFLKDMLVCFIFAVMLFSYVISFANYNEVRIYHILGAVFGFLSFNFNFSTIFHKIFKKYFSAVKNKMLCCGKKVYSIICAKRQKNNKSEQNEQAASKNTDLKNKNIWVYNL